MRSSNSGSAVAEAAATRVSVTDDTLTVDLVDGRTISVPLVWYPRLHHATAAERARWVLTPFGEGIHWPDLDEDLSCQHLVEGRGSNESGSSLQRWLDSRLK